MSKNDPFNNFDSNFDKMFERSFSHPKRTFALGASFVIFLNILFWAVIIGLVVGGILFLKAHGVF